MNCAICGGDLESGRTTLTLRHRSTTAVVFEDVPSLVCRQCGESWTDEEVSERLLDMVWRAAGAVAGPARLTRADAATIRGMLARGDRPAVIAALFGVVPGRVTEIAAGRRFADVPPSPQSDLPPPGHVVKLAGKAA